MSVDQNPDLKDRILEAILATASDDQESVRQAVDFLLEHPQQSHPALLYALAEAQGNPSWVATLLGRIGQPESVALLHEKLTIGVHSLRLAAAMALAEHPHPSALAALLSALEAERPEVCGVAAMGLGRRGDPSACAAIKRHLHDADVNARVPVIEALWDLGCLSRTDLNRIRTEETDELVHELIDGLLPAQSASGS